LTLIDAPGVGSFMKNLLVGLSEADVAVLVVAGNLEEF
jgi:translation elongation factor EF-1alpha